MNAINQLIKNQFYFPNQKITIMKATIEDVRNSVPGTRYTRVKCYNGEGDYFGAEYVPCDDNPDYDYDLEDAQAVAPGYFTETTNIKRK